MLLARTRCVGAYLPFLARSPLTKCAASSSFKTMAAGVPSLPADVLKFWFASSWDPANRSLLSSPAAVGPAAQDLWYKGGADTDAQCRTFSALVRAAAGRELSGPAWESPEGVLARVILLDQIARGAFRGTADAFAGDAVALELTLGAIADGSDESMEAVERHFLYSPLIHSEVLADQDLLIKKNSELMAKYPEITIFGFTKGFAESHRNVVAKFGRFPHRNALLGRESTPEEAAWLAGPDVPGWARSQTAAK